MKARYIPFALALTLALTPMQCAAAKEVITPECHATMLYSVGVLDIHMDRDFNGAGFAVYRVQPEGEFLYYSFFASLIDECQLSCPLIEGEYKLEITVPSAEGTEFIGYKPFSFVVEDPDMDEQQSFEMTHIDIHLSADASLEENQSQTWEPVLKDRVIQQSFDLVAAHRPFRLGDMNSDGEVNASDAAHILTAASIAGAGGDSGLSAMAALEGDLNGDGEVNAKDAAIVLHFSAEVAAGNIEDDVITYARERLGR